MVVVRLNFTLFLICYSTISLAWELAPERLPCLTPTFQPLNQDQVELSMHIC